MSGLKETLSDLSTLAPEIPAHVGKVQAAADTLKSRVADLMSDLNARREAAGALADGLSSALQALRTDATSHAGLVEEAVGGLETTADDSRAGLETRAAELSPAAAAAADDLASLESELATSAGRGRDAWQRAAASLETLGQRAQAARDEAQAAVDAAIEAGETLGEAASETAQKIAAAGAALTARIDDLLARGRDRLGRLLGHVQSLVQGHAGVLDTETAHLEERCTALAADLAGRLEALVSAASDAADAVTTSMATLRAEVDVARTSCAGAREGLMEQTEALAAAVEPIPGGIAAVRTGAERVGLSWS